MVRMYEENEIHKCNTCGLTLRVSFAAVPVMPLMCCDIVMEFLGMQDDIVESLDLTPAAVLKNSREEVYKAGSFYNCEICNIEVEIIRTAQPVERLDCCGEGMDLMS